MLQRLGIRTLVLGLLIVESGLYPSPLCAQGTDPKPFPAQTAIADPPTTRPAPTESESKVPRPQAEKVPAEYKLSPEIANILKSWERQTAGIKYMEGTFLRYEYDKVFLVEKRAVGAYYFEAPDHGRMDFLADKRVQAPNDKHKVDEVQYTVVPANSEVWICDGAQLLSIDLDEKQYHRITIPADFQGEAIKNSPLPFLFGMKADEFEKRFMMQLGPMHNPGGKDGKPRIHIIAYPLMEQQRREFQKAEVLVDPKTFYPQAVKLFDTTGNKETTYFFTRHEEKKFRWFDNKFNVNLRGYKCLTNEQAPPQKVSDRQLFRDSDVPRTAQEAGKTSTQ